MQGFQVVDLHHWLDKRPTVGDLQNLCEENYRRLHSLVPQLKRLEGDHRSCQPDHLDLLLSIVEQTRYTTLIRLTYEFPENQGGAPEPNALLRVYHDAQQLEVEDLHQQTLPTEKLFEAPGLANKWRLNLFVAKWLAFCIRQGHFFIDDVAHLRQPVCDLS